MIYMVDDTFNEISNLEGEFILAGDDYEGMMKLREQFGDKVKGLSYCGPIEAIKSAPDMGMEMVVDSSNVDDIIANLYMFKPNMLSLRVRDMDSVIPVISKMRSFPYTFNMVDHVESMEQDALAQVIEKAFHDDLNKLVVQPVFKMIESFAFSRDMDVWRMLRFSINEMYCISKGKVGYWLNNKELVELGQVKDGKIVFNQAHADLESRINESVEDDCMQCSYYFACKGSVRFIYGKCDNWLYLFDEVHKKSLELREDIKQKK